jgi:uncharacterized RDD family membrane protein YckC
MQSPTKVVGRRVAALVIDLLIMAAIVALSWFALTDTTPGTCIGGGFEVGDDCRGFYDDSKRTLWFVILIATWLTLFAILPGVKGSSPGKSALGIKVVNAEGQPPGLLRGFARGFFLWVIDLSIIGLIVALVTARNQRVGDLVASTYVIHKDAAGDMALTQPPAGQFAPTSGWDAPPASAPPQPEPQAQAGPAGEHKADWYPDPHGVARLRYWDGQRWTEHTSA